MTYTGATKDSKTGVVKEHFRLPGVSGAILGFMGVGNNTVTYPNDHQFPELQEHQTKWEKFAKDEGYVKSATTRDNKGVVTQHFRSPGVLGLLASPFGLGTKKIVYPNAHLFPDQLTYEQDKPGTGFSSTPSRMTP